MIVADVVCADAEEVEREGVFFDDFGERRFNVGALSRPNDETARFRDLGGGEPFFVS